MANKPVMPEFKSAEEILRWRDQQRQKRRVMTLAEYNLWCRNGDFFDSPTSNDTFRGGLTIVLDNRPPIYGGFED